MDGSTFLTLFLFQVEFQQGVAKALKYIKKGKHLAVEVDGAKVILAAGVFNTPHILLQSGIGPKTSLARAAV